jgi:inner membrane protein
VRHAVNIPDSDIFKWYGEVRTPRAQLTDIVANDCVAAAAMRFIRVPWLTRVDGELVIGDLRYDREKELGFAEIALGTNGQCPRFVSPWLPPRSDLLH